MRTAFFGIALLVLSAGVWSFGLPFLTANTVSSGGDSCDETHLKSNDLTALEPGDISGMQRVYRAVQHCTTGGIGTSEAEVKSEYAAELTPEAAARAFIASAVADGWTVTVPASGKPVVVSSGMATISMSRTVDGHRVHLDAFVYETASKPKPNPNANVAKVIASGRPTGLTVRIWVDGASALPTMNAGKLGLFPTPDLGIGR